MKRVQNQGEPIVIDACVLAVFAVADLLLRLARYTALFTPRWTDAILEEMQRTHRKFGWGERVAASFRACLNPAFPEARIVGYEHLIAQCTNDVGDRHVLAAAIQAQVGRILTFNLDDFKAPDLAPWGVVAVHPDDFLLELYGKDPVAVRSALEAQAEKKGASAQVRLGLMARQVPNFAAKILAELA